MANRQPGKLTGYDCQICLNRGFLHGLDSDGHRYAMECKCMATRRSMARIERSGLSDLLERYTFERWQTPEPWQENMIRRAKKYAANPEGWFVVAGRPGSGKTHICTAICGELLRRGMDTRYMLWRETIGRLKAATTESEEYTRLMEPLKAAPVLYIDDLFKTGKGQEPTAADFNVAFELIGHRYNQRGSITLISSELTIGQIAEYDEAVGSRIYERSKANGCYFDLSEKNNWRLR